MKILFLSLIYWSFSLSQSFAGERSGEFAIVNASTQPMNKEGTRLFELFQKDIKEMYNSDKYGFPWTVDGDTTLKVVPSSSVKGCFGPMIVLKDTKKLKAAMEKIKVSDGLIVFEYDLKAKKMRLKHFGWDAKENILVKLPLNKGGAMNLSVFKHTRRAALVAVGHSFEWTP